mmetsp:Transcript_34152/g.80387  ORF Transcript_34152/g.80387 Transcript_34152/m.80387 type:complete len:501 (-) Transcript_34152:227-1729(-)
MGDTLEAANREKALDDLIAQDFGRLSFHDRNAINDEMHGVASLAPEETPEMVASALLQLDSDIKSIPYKPAFDRSQQWNALSPTGNIDCTRKVHSYNKESLCTGTVSTYVNTCDFRMRFLRAELFDTKKAALRLVKFLELVMELYDGDEELLRRPIGLSDLKTKDEKDFLKLGTQQLLPFRDRSGRRVIAMVPDLGLNQPTVRFRGKIFLYLWFVTSDNEETQKKGVVLVSWPRIPENRTNIGPYVPPHDGPSYWLKFVDSVPVRICAFHLCKCNHSAVHFLKLLFFCVGSVMRNNHRIRMKIHTGDRTEISYQLLGYGIPVDLLPLTDSGKIKTKNFFLWLKVRKALEDSRCVDENAAYKPLSRIFCGNNIECPGLNDVIFRSGKNHMSHPGNVMFQGLIESKHAEHCVAHQDDKATITWWVVNQVELKGGRFLEWNNQGMWSQILDRAQIRSKVSSCFRTFRRKLNAFKNRQEMDSCTSDFESQDGNKRRKTGGGHCF